MTARTPGPWTLGPCGPSDGCGPGKQQSILGADGAAVCRTVGYDDRAKDRANAEFIVRAVNAHDALVAALAALLGAVQSNHAGGAPKTSDDIFAEAGRQAVSALALARGAQP